MLNHRALSTVFFISLAINVFIIGFLFGKPGSRDPVPDMMPEMNSAYKELPRSNQEEVKEILREHQKKILLNKRALYHVRLEIAEVLENEPLKKQRLSKLFEKMYELSSENIGLGQQSLYQILIQLPLKERQKVAKLLKKSRKPKASRKKPST